MRRDPLSEYDRWYRSYRRRQFLMHWANAFLAGFLVCAALAFIVLLFTMQP